MSQRGYAHTLIGDGSVRAEDRLLGIERLVLGEDSAGNVEARHHVILRESEAQALGVVVDQLNLLELEANPALVTAGEGLLDLAGGELLGHLLDVGLGLLGGTGAGEEVGAGTGDTNSGGTEEEGAAAAAGGGLGGIRAAGLERL